MRFNDKELATLSLQDADLEGRLNYRKTPSGNFTQSGSAFKERWFKLKYNLLFYFKINDLGRIEDKPAGVFVLETAKVQMELSGAQFAFSITFTDDPDKKHIFAARSESTVHSWVHTIKNSTYESLRSKLIVLQGKLNRLTGKKVAGTVAEFCRRLGLQIQKVQIQDDLANQDPLLMYPRNKGMVRDVDWSHRHHYQQEGVVFVKSSFKSHLRFSDSPAPVPAPTTVVPEANLIEL